MSNEPTRPKDEEDAEAEPDADVARHEKEMQERGAKQKGEGRIP